MKDFRIITWAIWFIGSLSFGQEKGYNYTREIMAVDISQQWHKVILPEDIYTKASSELSNIRIWGVTEGRDTIEAPYLLKRNTENSTGSEISYNTTNISSNGNWYFYTFEIPSEEIINKIRLNFSSLNFDLNLKLEGSQDQQKWFTILENYRIISIKNKTIDFKFTSLNFPDSKFRYYRISFERDQNPDFKDAQIMRYQVSEGSFRNYPIQDLQIIEDKKSNSTQILVELPYAVPVSHIGIKIKDTLDYYRPVKIKYLQDSSMTFMGWNYNYAILGKGILNSFEDKEFKLSNQMVKKFEIEIYNENNQPLNLAKITVKGYENFLITSFTEPAVYFLTYGSGIIDAPQDNLALLNNTPSELIQVELGAEKKIKVAKDIELFIKNKPWVWIGSILFIFLLGISTLKIIRRK